MPTRTLRLSVLTLVLLAGLVVGIWFERRCLLQEAADLWIVSDPVTRADAVVILGGGLEVRPFAAADLYHKGLVKKVLISSVAEERTGTIGAIPGHTELNRMVLLKLGVPDTAIEIFGTANRNTRDEAFALRNWADHHTASVFIVPTEIFSARRVRWIFHRQFASTPIRIEVPSFEPPTYTRTDWWTTEQGLITFQNEFLKYIYYRLEY